MTMTHTVPPQTTARFDETRIIERPDGFYWQSMQTDETFGPFASLQEAVADMEYNAESGYEPGETLEEADQEIGLADWIDPDTGQPAEESVPRIEDEEH